MPCSKDKPSFKHHLGPIYTLVFNNVVVLLLLTHRCAGQSQVVTPSQPIVATLGDDITLPCHLKPAVDVTSETVEWARPDMDPRFVYVRRGGVELESRKHPGFAGRTSLSINKLKDGDISLKLDKVKVSDEGTYRCFVPSLQRESSVQLVVGVTSSLIISLEKTDGDEDVSGAVLQCESKGWYPKPEVLWLDAEGNLLSAGPAEPIRGPDGLYTVSSRVTVEKKHSKSFTCRVQQKNINQTRETTIFVSDDLFKFSSSSSGLIIGFAVGLSFCILLILLLVFYIWRLKSSKTKKTHQLEEGREREQLMSAETEKVSQQLQEEQQRREEAENKVKNLEDQLETKNKEVKGQQAKVQRLIEEKQRNMKELPTHKDKQKSKEMEELKKLREEKQKLETEKTKVSQQLNKEQQRRKEAENKVKNLEDQLKTKNKEHDHSITPQPITAISLNHLHLFTTAGEQPAELQQLSEETQWNMMELNEEMEKKEKELQTLKNELERKNKRLQRVQGSKRDTSVEVKSQQADMQRLNEEIQEKEMELQTLKKELERRNKEMDTVTEGQCR